MTLTDPPDSRPPVGTVAVTLTATVTPTGEIERLWIEGRSLTSDHTFMMALKEDQTGLTTDSLIQAAGLWTFLLEANT